MGGEAVRQCYAMRCYAMRCDAGYSEKDALAVLRVSYAYCMGMSSYAYTMCTVLPCVLRSRILFTMRRPVLLDWLVCILLVEY